MTLVAGFKTLNTPVLLGDFVLSNTGTQERIGLSRKIIKLSDNLVVGWAGSHIAAITILRKLYEKFYNKRVKRDDLQQCLSQLGTEESSSLHVFLVGWVVDGEPCCFLWNSAAPEELYEYKEPVAIGSGTVTGEYLANQIRRSADLQGHLSPSGEAPSGWSEVALAGTISAQLMALELTNSQYDSTYGYMYELCYFENGRFAFFDDVGYVIADVDVDQAGKLLRLQLHPSRVIYRGQDEYAILITLGMNNWHIDQVRQEGFPAVEINQELVSSIIKRNLGTREDRCPKNCYIAFRVRSDIWGLMNFGVFQGSDTPPDKRLFRATETGFVLDVDKNWIESKIADSIASRCGRVAGTEGPG